MKAALCIAIVLALGAASALAQQGAPLPAIPPLRYDVPPPPPVPPDLSFKPAVTVNGVNEYIGGRGESYNYGSDFYATDLSSRAVWPYQIDGQKTFAWVCSRWGPAIAFHWERVGLAAGPGAPLQPELCAVSARASHAASSAVVRELPLVVFPGGASVRTRARLEDAATPRRAAGTQVWRSQIVGGGRAAVGARTHRIAVTVDMAVAETMDRLSITITRAVPEYPVALGGLDRIVGSSTLLAGHNPDVPVSLRPVRETMDEASWAWLPTSWREGKLLHIESADQAQAKVDIPLSPERARSLKLDKGLFFVMDEKRAIHAVAPYTVVAP